MGSYVLKWLDYFINLISFSGFLDKRNYTCAEEESIFFDENCYSFRGHNIYCCLQYKQEVNRKESEVNFYIPWEKESIAIFFIRGHVILYFSKRVIILACNVKSDLHIGYICLEGNSLQITLLNMPCLSGLTRKTCRVN